MSPSLSVDPLLYRLGPGIIMLPTPQKEAYAISILRTCRDMLDISGSGEHRSIHGLQYAII